MKKLIFSSLLCVLATAMSAQTAVPHTCDFSAVNAQGDTIYYLITSPQTVAVSYRCDSATYRNIPVRRNLYRSKLKVPDRVVWQSAEYKVTSVARCAFYNCPQASLTLPAGIDSVLNQNFSYCSELNELELPASIRYIGDSCFLFTYKLEKVEFGDSLLHLGSKCFDFSGIRRFACPPLLTKINRSFLSCSNLSEVTLPEGMDTIDGSFLRCPLLEHIRLPQTLVYVYGFEDCGLKEVSFPASVRYVTGFSSCPALSSVAFSGGGDSIGRAFQYDTSLHILDLSPTRMRTWHRLCTDFCPTVRAYIPYSDLLQTASNATHCPYTTSGNSSAQK